MVSQQNVKTAKVTGEIARQYLNNVPEEKAFQAHDGQTFKSLKELAQGLEKMDDETYHYHAKGSKNDFATWVEEIIGDKELASMLRQDMNRSEAAGDAISRIEYLIDVQ